MKRLITTICAVFVFCFVLSGTAVQAAADAAGESLNAYIVGAVAQRMDREQPTEDALPPETEEMLK